LAEPPEVWARKILSVAPNYKRERYVEAVIAAGYDISNMAEVLENMYYTGRKD
jgi:hypothetical protein